MRGRLATGVACLVAAASTVGLASCGVPVNTSPELLSQNLLPKALTTPPPTLPAVKPISSRDQEVAIYLLSQVQRLIVEPRIVAKPVTAQGVLDVLEQGPLPHEFADGLGSALLPGSRLTVLRVQHGIAAVQLDQSFFELIGESSVLELAQIVDTLTSIKGLSAPIKAVQFYFDGAPTDAEIGNGRVVARPVTPKDYLLLVQP